MEKYISEHKNKLILLGVSVGATPAEVAVEFNKQAACLNDCCEALLADTQKQASGALSALSALKAVGKTTPILGLAAFSLPSVIAYAGGNLGGQYLAHTLTERNEMPMKAYQTLDETVNFKAETKKILDRIEAKKKHDNRLTTRSVRQLY